MPNKLRITLVHSGIGHPEYQKITLRSLGLGRLHKTVEMQDNHSVRGMIKTVEHLVKVDEVKE
ncbi:MAG: 50S ribosomal protein L30 [Chloroflexi bacterium]|nr:50S ribosomal protein L30 [Chloroflexota bacterium]MCL5109921.1 50S ribosomal protein L30 [Chloroflexota bacterium]